ncbi:hypothetical protein [Nostoc commune]|uniref:hypothetical protein n=1 Tax=Nostoc commune TaxID=1178 RepID=UPI0018C6782C|nr:hypothetical protein [Nostoc commune]MBG1259645.1 hypothetical protein [Nostoc commune BAE]
MLNLEDAQRIGLQLKSILRFIAKRPAGCTVPQLEREFPDRDIEILLELAIAIDLIKDDYDGDIQVFKIKNQ